MGNSVKRSETTVSRSCHATHVALFLSPLLLSWVAILRARIPRINFKLVQGKQSVWFFFEITYLCTSTCRAARPRLDNNRRDDRRASKARAAEECPLTRWLDSRSSRLRGSERILLASIRDRVLCEIRPEVGNERIFISCTSTFFFLFANAKQY